VNVTKLGLIKGRRNQGLYFFRGEAGARVLITINGNYDKPVLNFFLSLSLRGYPRAKSVYITRANQYK
jgi:hypothetical protein